MGATSARTKKVAILTELLGRLEPDEIAIAAGFLAGAPRQGRVGVGFRTIYGIDQGHADEPTLRNDYHSGTVNETNNLTNVAIIDLQSPDPGAFHDAYRSFTTQTHLETQESHFPVNDVI